MSISTTIKYDSLPEFIRAAIDKEGIAQAMQLILEEDKKRNER